MPTAIYWHRKKLLFFRDGGHFKTFTNRVNGGFEMLYGQYAGNRSDGTAQSQKFDLILFKGRQKFRDDTVPVPEIPLRTNSDNTPLKERVGNYERALILAALEKTDGNQKKAAQLLSINATTLNEKLKRLKIKKN